MNKSVYAKLNNVLKHELKYTVDCDESVEEKLERADTLINLKKILDNYDELEPLLKSYFLRKVEKDRWDLYKGEEKDD